jgi:hypothetical protein
MFGLFRWGLSGTILMAAALIHFVRRRPDTYWLFVILFLGPLGSLIYLVVEALPELRDPGAFKFVGRARRISDLESDIRQNPSAANYEELGQLYLDKGQWQRARVCFDRSIAQRSDSPDPFYRRALAELELEDFPAAIQDLERTVRADVGYDFHRAAGLLAWAYARTGQKDLAQSLFNRVLSVSSTTETQYHYAEFLASQGRTAEARQWLDQVLAKRSGMPGFQRRRARPWFRRAKMLRSQLVK